MLNKMILNPIFNIMILFTFSSGIFLQDAQAGFFDCFRTPKYRSNVNKNHLLSKREKRRLEQWLYLHSKELTKDIVLYRWGGDYDRNFIGDSIDLSTVNRMSEKERRKGGITPNSIGGEGLYLSPTIGLTVQYADKKNPCLLAVTIPKGAYFLDLTNQNIFDHLYGQTSFHHNNIYAFKEIPFANSFLIEMAATNYYVLKKAEGIKISEFSGQNIPEKDKLEIMNYLKENRNTSNSKHHLKDLNNPENTQIKNYLLNRLDLNPSP